MAQRIQQRLRLEQSAAALGVEHDGIGSRGDGRLIAPHQQLRAHLARHLVAEGEHLANLKPVSMCSSGKGIGAGIKGLLRQPQHHRRILADGVEHHRPLELRRHLAQNMNALRLKQAQMVQPRRM